MTGLRLFLFDLDGVVVDTSSLLETCFEETANRLGVQLQKEELPRAIRSSPKVGVRHLFPDQSSDPFPVFQEIWEAKIIMAKPFSGVLGVLEVLIRSGLYVGIATSRNASDATKLLRHAGCLGQMQTLVTWGSYRQAKPSPRCIEVALAETNTPAHLAAYIGDQFTDIQASKNAGTVAIGAVWDRYSDRSELQLAGADLIIERPEELLGFIASDR